MNASCLPGTRVKEGECEYLMNRYGEWIGSRRSATTLISDLNSALHADL
jgi:hypothetical protein